MTHPDITVATNALRQEATTWTAQSELLLAAKTQVEGLRIMGLEAGMFALIIDAYTQVVDVVSGRCAEGVQRTAEIGQALRQVADVYDAEEQGNVHRLTGLY